MKYRVVGYITVTITEIVNATSPEEAVEKADMDYPTLCHQCSNKYELDDVNKVEVRDIKTDEIIYEN